MLNCERNRVSFSGFPQVLTPQVALPECGVLESVPTENSVPTGDVVSATGPQARRSVHDWRAILRDFIAATNPSDYRWASTQPTLRFFGAVPAIGGAKRRWRTRRCWKNICVCGGSPSTDRAVKSSRTHNWSCWSWSRESAVRKSKRRASAQRCNPRRRRSASIRGGRYCPQTFRG
jgi:hypothetical protein